MNGSFLSGMMSQVPELLLAITAIVIVFADTFAGMKSMRGSGVIAICGALVAFVVSLVQMPPILGMSEGVAVLNGMAMNDGVQVAAKLIILFTLIIGLLLSFVQARERKYSGEFHALVLFAAFGALVLAGSANLVVLILGLEILSIPLYTLVAFDTTSKESREAGLKYLILGSLASGFTAIGCALYYVGSGTLSIHDVHVSLESRTIFAVGSALILAGLMFKGGMLPFFAWSPDVYQGAPDFAVGLIAALAKVGTFILLIRFVPEIAPNIASTGLLPGLMFLTMATMLTGNLLALVQSNIKRLLAFSAVSHAGYMFLGILALRQDASAGVLLYLAVYAPVLVASFAIVSLFPSGKDGQTIGSYTGLVHKAPLVAIFFTVFLVSLAGLPPLGGFIAKAITFLGAVRGGLVWLVAFAMIVSVIGVYYYLRVVVHMFMYEPRKISPPSTPELARVGLPGRIAFWAVCLLVLVVGVYPSYILYLMVLAAMHIQGLIG